MKLIKIVTILLLINFSIQASSEEEVQCAGAIPQSSIQAQTGGLYKPSSNGANEYMKALVVYVQFELKPMLIFITQHGRKTSCQTWADDLISSSPSSNYPRLYNFRLLERDVNGKF